MPNANPENFPGFWPPGLFAILQIQFVLSSPARPSEFEGEGMSSQDLQSTIQLCGYRIKTEFWYR